MNELAETSVLAARGRVIQRLIEGDPVTWTILVVVVVGMIAWAVIKNRMNKGPNQDSRPMAEHRQTEGDADRRS